MTNLDSTRYLRDLAAEVHSGRVSRRAFLKTAAGLGLSAAGALLLLNPAEAQSDPNNLSKVLAEAANEMEKLQKDLKDAVDEYNRKVDEMDDMDEGESLNDQGDENVYIRLRYPAGKSPKVFQTGWVFAAECLIRPEDDDDEPLDVSGEVEWSGTADFSPDKGVSSRPSFNGTGSNTIILSITHKDKRITKTNHIDVVSTDGYAAVDSLAECKADSHGCPACPHPVIGPILQGSPNVMINGKPAARLGDAGIHTACCGPNTYKVAEGDPEVLINGKPAAKRGCKTLHCGGSGKIL